MLMDTMHVRFLEKAKNAPYSLFFIKKQTTSFSSPTFGRGRASASRHGRKWWYRLTRTSSLTHGGLSRLLAPSAALRGASQGCLPVVIPWIVPDALEALRPAPYLDANLQNFGA
jgi:hypothetical protein